MTLKQLIYSKCFNDTLQQKLLSISDSPTWVEDFIDLIGKNEESLIEKEKEEKKEEKYVEEFINIGGIEIPINKR